MARNISIVLALFLPLASFTAAAPPKVAATTPDNGQIDFSPDIKEIRIEFDQPMNPRGCSIVGGGDAFPNITGNPTWIDDKTILIPVSLEPQHEYWLSINSDTFKGFRGTSGDPAEWYPLNFKTRAPAAAPPAQSDVTPQQNKLALAAPQQAIDRDYSYRDLNKIDWTKEIASRQSNFQNAKTSNEFARLAAHLLRLAQDAHVTVQAGDVSIGTLANSASPNFDVQILQQAIPHWTERPGGIVTGHFDGGDQGADIGYILFSQCTKPQADDFDAALDDLKDTKALILDARFNGGGDEDAALQVAGRFVEKPALYAKDRIRQNGSWQGPFDRLVQPRTDAARYTKLVVVLIGPKVASSAESFVLMMKYGAHATLLGDHTAGSSGRPIPHQLGNAVTVYLSSWEDQLPDGTLLQGHGVPPDVITKTTPRDFQNSDPLILAALRSIRLTLLKQ